MVAPLGSDIRAEQLERIRFTQAMEWRKKQRPHLFYKPHDKGQLQFHQARHYIRFLCPGNGWGKSIAAANEIQAWMEHKNRWRVTPTRPISALWFCPKMDQFEAMKPKLIEAAFGLPPTGPRWTKDRFVWPEGRGELLVASTKASWTTFQGAPRDLVIFDEHFPQSLYVEMLLRRRADQKTEFVIGATMTKGMTWEYPELYVPWLEHHQAKGLDEESAMKVQTHERIFCWPKGGIDDNPGCDEEDRRNYREGVPYSCDKEKLVRLGGGFQDWSGESVFHDEGVAWLIEQQKALGPGVCENGLLVPRAA
jgi:hypothetical protein